MAKAKNSPPVADQVREATTGAGEGQAGTNTPADVVADGEVAPGAAQAADAADAEGLSPSEGASQADAGAVGGDDHAGEGEPSTPVDPLVPTGKAVEVLVLSDNHLGKVGQVIEVDEAHVEALRLGGLIDPHPNAIKAAKPQE